MKPPAPASLRTRRLDLVPATAALLHAELANRPAFARLLGARVPPAWPPPLYDRGPVKYTLKKLRAAPHHVGWWTWYLILREHGTRVAVGVCGYTGPPRKGVVEVGYAILPWFQGRGLATEAVTALLERAFALSRVELAIAHTLPDLAASIRVLERLGFTQRGAPLEESALRFELTREEFLGTR